MVCLVIVVFVIPGGVEAEAGEYGIAWAILTGSGFRKQNKDCTLYSWMAFGLFTVVQASVTTASFRTFSSLVPLNPISVSVLAHAD